MKRAAWVLLVLTLTIASGCCGAIGAREQPTYTPYPTYTPPPSPTVPPPTYTPAPTYTPYPTYTAVPTLTPALPTNTPPPDPTPTPPPASPTPAPSLPAGSIFFRSYAGLGDNVTHNTGILASDYDCGLVGMAALEGDINENDPGHILRAYTHTREGRWWIRADFRSHYDHENWDVNMLCVPRPVAEER